MKYVVAALVVVSALHRLNDEEFIIQSFHLHNTNNGQGGTTTTGTGHRKLGAANDPSSSHTPPPPSTVAIHNAIPLEMIPHRIKTDPYTPGTFCYHCEYNTDMLCGERVDYIVSVYKKNRTFAERAVYREVDKQNIYRLPEGVVCRTPEIYHNTYEEEDEPSIILHAGPHKTGTTALQAFIYDLIYANSTIFPKDNLRVPSYKELPGVFGKEGVGLNLPHCCVEGFKNGGSMMNAGMCSPMRHAFQNFVQDAYNKSQTILIVAEDFDRAEINFSRLNFYLRPYKKIKVVVTYRRLHDWLPSWYNQIIDHYKLIYARGDEPYPNFLEWMEKDYDKFLDAHGIRVADRYRRLDFVESVHLVNMHDIAGKDLSENFFCDNLRAEAVCAAIKEGAKPSKSNVGFDHEFQRLAIRAKLDGRMKGKLDKPIKLAKASQFLETKVKERNMTLPRICPSAETLKKVFYAELEAERTHLLEWHDRTGGEEALSELYQKAVKKKFCSLDVDTIFERGLMDDIFRECKYW